MDFNLNLVSNFLIRSTYSIDGISDKICPYIMQLMNQESPQTVNSYEFKSYFHFATIHD